MANIFTAKNITRLINTQLILKRHYTSKWIKPPGNSTGINIYNCVAGEKVPLILNHSKIATWYACGPTVYDSAHIGHASCYVKLDILQRILKSYFHINLVTAMGVTDIDDKIINKSRETSVSVNDIVKQYENEFWLDLLRLGVAKPMAILRVSDYIDSIEKFIKKLLLDDKAYITSDGSVYFDICKSADYGKLQNIILHEEEGDANVSEKRNTQDFALWKAHKPGEHNWTVEWGKGRPGWHIECSAMVSRLFGSELDFHAGGIDLQFPHHENEEAQSCAYHDTKQWVKYWIHTGHLHMPGDVKMSKSLKNTISISELLQSYSGNAFRMACLMSHYRSSVEYSDEIMDGAEILLNKFKYFIHDCQVYINDPSLKTNAENKTLREQLNNTMDIVDVELRDDFNTSKCIYALLNLMTVTNRVTKNSEEIYDPIGVSLISNFVSDSLNTFGLQLYNQNNESELLLNSVIDTTVEFRKNIRSNALLKKDMELLKECDNVRNKLKEFKINITDKGNKSLWLKA